MKSIEKFINGLGDFNHLAIVSVVSFIVTGVLYIVGAFHLAAMVAAVLGFGFSCFYYGKEHWTYIKLGELKSLNPNNWHRHDRRQTIFVWIFAAIYPILVSMI